MFFLFSEGGDKQKSQISESHLQCVHPLLQMPSEKETPPPLSLSHSHPPLSVAMPQSVRRGEVDVWARQIQVFIERSYEMGEESHYLLIKYWFLATQVLTSKLIWADPWDQRLEVCVSAPIFVCERKKDRIGKQHQVEQRQRNDHKTYLEEEWLKFQRNACGKCGRREGKVE